MTIDYAQRVDSMPQRRATVLIADDSEDTREMYAEYLRFVGYEVALAVNGRDALDKARANPPDVLVLDLTVPRLDGWAVAKGAQGHPATAADGLEALILHVLG